MPSSTVYCTAQDSLGYIWFGTEAGLVRFDGTKFRVFTTQDGLPDNEVLGLMFDHVANRMWIVTYCKATCYYKNGKFFTVQNDSSLRTVTCDFGEFIAGNIQPDYGVFLYNGFSIYGCTRGRISKYKIVTEGILQTWQWPDQTMDMIFRQGVMQYDHGRESFYHGDDIDSTNDGGLWIGNTLFLYRKGRIVLYEKSHSGQYKLKGKIQIEGNISAFRLLRLRSNYLFTISGVGVFQVDTSLRYPAEKIWSGAVNDIFVDKEENLWIESNDDGVYIIKSKSALNYGSANGLEHDNVTALYRTDDSLYLGNSYGEVFSLNNGVLNAIGNSRYTDKEKVRAISMEGRRFFVITGDVVYFDRDHPDFVKLKHRSGGPKYILKINNGRTILISMLASILVFDTKTSTYIELPFHKRIISMAEHPDGTLYCGSLDGLYTVRDSQMIHVVSSDPRMQGRITSLCFSPDSILWIGTPSNGVMAYDGKRVIAHVSRAKYLSYRGDICRKVVAGRPNEIWVATNSGIDKIRYHIGDSLVIDNVTPLNTTDGLLSDDVNDILVNDSLIYVATSHGLSILNENRITNQPAAPIYISQVNVNDKDSLIHDGVYELAYWQNNLRIEYVGVMLPSGAYMRYQYRLLGSGSDKWETTTNTSIEFRSLSSGTYTFEVAVLDKFGKRSERRATVKFHITPAFYKTVWFWAIIVVSILSTGFFIIRGRFRRRQMQYEKEQSYTNRIIDLEQQALKAQMNPHFIFNCLTAIQHFVNQEDVYSANMYLSNFARLIRKTLDLSGEQFISLDKEISYLENYIQLEKMRFQEKFRYEISADDTVDSYSAIIPPMLLQPIIENAIRHGLRYKDNNDGILSVTFSQEGDAVVCRIDDNGIGIVRSRELKTNSHVEYQSKGMKLTESRIAAINMISTKKISMAVENKYDASGRATGTLVIIKFEQ